MLPKSDQRLFPYVTANQMMCAAASTKSVILSMPFIEVIFFAVILAAVR